MNITSNRIKVFSYINAHSPKSVGVDAIAKSLGFRAANVLRTLIDLEKHGLVVRAGSGKWKLSGLTDQAAVALAEKLAPNINTARSQNGVAIEPDDLANPVSEPDPEPDPSPAGGAASAPKAPKNGKSKPPRFTAKEGLTLIEEHKRLNREFIRVADELRKASGALLKNMDDVRDFERRSGVRHGV